MTPTAATPVHDPFTGPPLTEQHRQFRQTDMAATLWRLGDTVTNVVNTLTLHGVTGTPNSACDCPIANYLANELGWDFAISDTEVTWLDDAHDPNRPATTHLPLPIAGFVERFDQYSYPHLITRVDPYSYPHLIPRPASHQPRERAVPCTHCRHDTWNDNAICDGCRFQPAGDDHLLTCDRMEHHKGGHSWETVGARPSSDESLVKRLPFGRVSLMVSDTGEIHEVVLCGFDGSDDDPVPVSGIPDWRLDSLDVILRLVSPLVEAVERCRTRGRSAVISVTDANSREVRT